MKEKWRKKHTKKGAKELATYRSWVRIMASDTRWNVSKAFTIELQSESNKRKEIGMDRKERTRTKKWMNETKWIKERRKERKKEWKNEKKETRKKVTNECLPFCKPWQSSWGRTPRRGPESWSGSFVRFAAGSECGLDHPEQITRVVLRMATIANCN